MAVRIAIDLNVHVRGGQANAALADADGPVAVGDQVLAVEGEGGICADATVTGIEPGGTDVDEAAVLVYLAVDWSTFRDDPKATEDPACE